MAAAATTPADDRVWVIVPAFNEATRLQKTLRDLCARWPNVVVVDDGSSDATWQTCGAFPVWRLRHAVNCGQGAALQTGIRFALAQNAEILVTFDADGQHCVEEIASLVQPVRAGEVDVALGSRFLGRSQGIPPARWLLLKAGIVFTRCISRIRVTDTHNGLRAFSRTAAEALQISQNRMAHASEILDQVRWLGLQYCEVPVTIRYSDETLAKGQSGWNALRIGSQVLLGRMMR